MLQQGVSEDCLTTSVSQSNWIHGKMNNHLRNQNSQKLGRETETSDKMKIGYIFVNCRATPSKASADGCRRRSSSGVKERKKVPNGCRTYHPTNYESLPATRYHVWIGRGDRGRQKKPSTFCHGKTDRFLS